MAATVLASMAFGALPATAAEHQVQMLNKGAEGPMAFEPSFLKIAPGDTVRFWRPTKDTMCSRSTA